ncbi:potassium-transporting ATPase alpha chain 2-like [Narcine bancroftii]|uniref:potassium-transporting ATPase alpha chain 2-like n=1 Tax=Narcine bancroftii TaxID=1343680 RepID=UPI003831D9A9
MGDENESYDGLAPLKATVPKMEEDLTSKRAVQLQAWDGPNVLTPPKHTDGIVKFLKQIIDGCSLLHWIAFAFWLAEGNTTAKDHALLQGW